MRWRVLLTLSLLANVALAVGMIVSVRRAAAVHSTASLEETNTALIRTNVVVRHQFISWSHVESPDYEVYIKNLRSIGCPEQTVRDIIIADVNALYARRRATEIISPSQEWWRSEPDPAVVKLAADKYIALDDERRALLTKLLGPDWEGGDMAGLPRPSRQGVALDGPILGVLPAQTKAAVDNISAQAEDRMQAYLDEMRNAGKTPDPAELARMRQQTRDQLAGVLNPVQLEEYLLRYSQTANDLRAQLGKLKYFNATADEFRAIFRATDPIDQQIALLGRATDPMTAAQRNSLQQQKDNALRSALGADRFLLFQKLQDPLYQQAVAQAIQAGDPSTADNIYAIDLVAQNEQNQIQSNTNLTDSQRAIALKQLDLDQLKASTAASGQPTLPEPTPPPPPPPSQTHVMGQTETVAALSRLFQVPMSSIQAMNPGVDLNNVRPGDTIRLPMPSASFPVPQLVVPRSPAP
ncbi:MAG TPA: LysM domain-containing protein [Candidatus Angelobacter sp.]|nr:LysM domain-containing protein [Candidatus Angelobacter sp.]